VNPGLRAAAFLALALPACAPALAGGPGARAATSAAITPEDLRVRLEIVAHDSMEGREVGTRGMERATRYLTSELERLGLRPAGDDGGWLHRVELVRTRVAMEARLGDDPLPAGGLFPVNGIGGIPATSRTRVQGSVAYAGWQLDPRVAPGDELAPEALRDAVLVVRVGAPPGVPGVAGTRPRFDPQRLFRAASGLQAVILVAEGPLEEFLDYAAGLARSGSVEAAGAAREEPGEGPVVFLASAAVAARLVGRPRDEGRPSAGGGAFRAELRRSVEPVEASNVVAVVPGRDPSLSAEYVALGAHHDHDGIGPPVDGDSIYNGADDDGSGTVALLEIAERLAALPPERRPARSILLVWHTAEEKGLLGSAAFTERPTVPRDAIVAQLNLDMVGRNHPDTLHVVGARRIATVLGDVVEAVNGRQERPFVLDRTWDAPGHPERIYCRSDHYSYARFGIPIAFFFTGLHEDYHRPSDTAEKVDYGKLARVTRLVHDVAVEVADRPERPRPDRPVPPPGAPCT
jgi:hypothetical protein